MVFSDIRFVVPVALVSGCVLLDCQTKPLLPEGKISFYEMSEQEVISVEYHTGGKTTSVRRNRHKGTVFLVTERTEATGEVRECRSTVAHDLVVRPLSSIHGLRMLKATEVDLLEQREGAGDGLLRIQDTIANDDGGTVEPSQWKVYAHLGLSSSIVAISPRDATWAWEVDIPKKTIQALRDGCKGLGDPSPSAR